MVCNAVAIGINMALNPVHGSWVGVAPPKFELTDSAIVDGELWYTIRTYNRDVAAWLRSQSKLQRHEYGGSEYRYGYIFDVDEKLYILMCLSWA